MELPRSPSDRFDIRFDIHGYDSREAGSINLHLTDVHDELYKKRYTIFGWLTLEWSARFCEEFNEYGNFQT